MDAVPSKGRDPLLSGRTNARMENISIPSDLFYRKLYTDLLYLFNNGDLVRNLSFLSRDNETEGKRYREMAICPGILHRVFRK